MQSSKKVAGGLIAFSCVVAGAIWYYSIHGEKTAPEEPVLPRSHQGEGITETSGVEGATAAPADREAPARTIAGNDDTGETEGQKYHQESWSEPALTYWGQLFDPAYHQDTVIFEFSNFLDREGDPAFFADIEKMLGDPAQSPKDKELILSLLRQTPRVESMAILVGALPKEKDESARNDIAYAISDLAEYSELKNHETLEGMSRILEEAWPAVDDNDGRVLYSIAAALARLGTADGVKLLIEALADGPDTVEELEESGDDYLRAQAAFVSATDIEINPDSTALLAEQFRLHQSNPDHLMFSFTSKALVSLANPEATTALLEWAVNAPEESAPSARRWFRLVEGRSGDSKLLIEEAVSEKSTFKSEKVRQEIIQALKDGEGIVIPRNGSI